MRKLLYIFAAIVGLGLTACDLIDLLPGNQTEDPETPEVPEGSGDNENSDGPEKPEEPEEKEFVILFTNDFHSQIEPISKEETYNADRGGIKRIKALVDSVRAAEPNVLLADAGDLVQGTYYFSLLNGVVEMMILEELGYDVRTIGNHEFDKKMIGLGDMLALSSVPVVSTNYDFSRTNIAGYINNSILLEAGGAKIGFIGLNVMLRNLVDPTACEGVEWQNAINVADIEALKLREAGADMVIALSHLGYEQSDEIYYDRGIALNTKHIDMIIGGHSHTFLNYPDYVTNLDGDKVPIVQTGSKGICLGYAKIKIDKAGKPSFTYKLIPVKSHLDAKIDPAFSDMIDTYSAAVKQKMEEVIGYCPKAIRKGSPESPLGNLTGDALVWMADEYYGVKADVGIYNSGGIRAEISAGDLTIGDIYAVYPFDNVLSIVTLNGKDLKKLFEYVASNGGLPINKEVRMVISNNKVKSVTVNGKPVEDSKTYTVATIDYLVNLGRYGLENASSRRDSHEIIRDYFVSYFRHLSQNGIKDITGSKDGRIKVE
ncbi:MAG: bifunctional metallophosphatase/5'-nucleotidase [Bacteroidales bacterium]|nr:bifunctional metallophosphatase/5'-nucleotidase [Bacteroidales bacterium]